MKEIRETNGIDFVKMTSFRPDIGLENGSSSFIRRV